MSFLKQPGYLKNEDPDCSFNERLRKVELCKVSIVGTIFKENMKTFLIGSI